MSSSDVVANVLCLKMINHQKNRSISFLYAANVFVEPVLALNHTEAASTSLAALIKQAPAARGSRRPIILDTSVK
jgi:energy-converting hydrogenase Eha subunit A